jgi:hypothetical protein
MATTVATPTKATVSKSIFNLDTLKKESVSTEYTVPTPLKDASELSKFDSATLLAMVNKQQARAAKMAARQSIVGPNPKAIYDFIKGFRLISPYSEITDKTEQTNAILTFVKAVAPMYEALKQIALASQAVETEDEDED